MSKFFKTLVIMLLAIISVASFAACGGEEDPNVELLKDYTYELNDDGDGYVLTKYEGDKKLNKITVPSKIKDKPVVELGKNLFRKASFVEVVLPSTVTTIGEGAFNTCEALTKINSGKVTHFMISSFESCTKLTTIDLSSATSISAKAFKNCTQLLEVTIPSTCDKIQPNVFVGCSRLKTVNLGEGVKEIGESAFSTCSALSNINLDYVSIIGDNAFNTCVSLVELNLKNVVLLGRNSFNSCNKLQKVVVGDKCIIFYANTFVFCSRLNHLEFADYDNNNKWISVDYNLQTPDVVWPHYMNTTKFKDPAENAANLGSLMGNPKKDNYYCKRAYIDQYPFGLMVDKVKYHLDVQGCACTAHGMPDCNILVNGELYTKTDYTLKVGEPISFSCYLSWGEGVPTRSDYLQISSVKLGDLWLQGGDYTNDNGTVTFLHTFDGVVTVTVYNSSTSKVVAFTINVIPAE